MSDEFRHESSPGHAPKKSRLFLGLVVIAIVLVLLGGLTLFQRRPMDRT